MNAHMYFTNVKRTMNASAVSRNRLEFDKSSGILTIFLESRIRNKLLSWLDPPRKYQLKQSFSLEHDSNTVVFIQLGRNPKKHNYVAVYVSHDRVRYVEVIDFEERNEEEFEMIVEKTKSL
jgi:hypothetical protein